MAELPDIEIYIKRPDLEQVTQWLATEFAVLQWQERNDQRLRGTAAVDEQSPSCDVLVLQNAVKGFASVWFKQNHTPWENDLDCARSAWAALGREIRASAGSWQAGAEEDLFYRIDGEGEVSVLWRTC